MIMDIHGTPHPYNASVYFTDNYLKNVRVCEPFLVSYEFNEMKVIGRPAPEVLKWLKPGESVKAVDCEEVINGGDENNPYFMWRVKCPTCGVLH